MNWITLVPTIGALSAIVLFVVNSFSHVLWNGFIDHAGEVTMTALSWLLYNGNPLYTALDAPERYSLQHGPMLYIVVGGVMKILGPGFHTAKLASFFSIIAIVIISWLWLKNFYNSKVSLWLLGIESGILLKWYYLYLVRADSLMLLCTVISLYFATSKKARIITILGIAIPLGVLLNLKIHGILYALPILILVQQKFGWRNFFFSCLLTGGIGLVPFLLPNISLLNYIHWLRASTIHGLSPQIILGNVSMTIFLLLIPFSFAIYRQINILKFSKKYPMYILSIILTMLTTAVIGGKYGSGSHHLAPFVPILMYLCIIINLEKKTIDLHANYQRRQRKLHTVSCIVGAFIFAGILINAMNVQGRYQSHMSSSYTISQNMLNDFNELEAKYQGTTMMIGYGEKDSLKIYDQLIPRMLFSGNTYLLDSSALNDMNFAGLSMPEATVNKLAEGSPRIWLIPAGNSPFSTSNAYNGSPQFSEKFRKTFLQNYKLAENTKYFDVWAYSSDDNP